MPNQPNSQLDNDEIDLHHLVTILWRQKVVIVLMGLIGGAIGLGTSYLSTQYVSAAVLLTPSITASTYKQYFNLFSNSQSLQQYLKAAKLNETPDGLLLTALAKNRDTIAQLVKPEIALSERDLKAFGIKINPESAGALIGVNLQIAHKSPTNGTPLTLLGEFIRDSIIRVDMENRLLEQCSKLTINDQNLRNEQLQANYAITEQEQHMTLLRGLVERHPESNTSDARQIVTLEKGNERYLPLTAQLLAAEIKISDMQIEMARRERERSMNALKLEYYCTAKQQLLEAATGRAFLDSLKSADQNVLKADDDPQDIVDQAWNQLKAEREEWSTTYLDNIRFIASPEGNEVQVRTPRLALGLAIGGILGGMLGLLIALVRSWWPRSGTT